MKTERIDKILSHHGFGTRRDVKKLLHQGVVKINGVLCMSPDQAIDTKKDEVTVNDEFVQIKENVYLMMNKCADVVCSTKDGVHSTVLDIVPEEYKLSFLGGDLHPIGRLDIDTEGLLLLTTDGSLTHRLTSPKHHISKTYYVRLEKGLDEKDQKSLTQAFANGLEIPPEGNESGFLAKKAELVWPSEEGGNYLTEEGPLASEVLITIYEGKYHQVKRMFSVCGNKVIYLKRVSVGSLTLDAGLKPGQVRELTPEELDLL